VEEYGSYVEGNHHSDRYVAALSLVLLGSSSLGSRTQVLVAVGAVDGRSWFGSCC